MLKSKLLITGACMLAMTGTTMTAVHAEGKAISQTGTTNVSYVNRNVIPDDNGEYGMIIPSAIVFKEAGETADASVEITGINGFDLDKDWSDLSVTATVKSNEGYVLKEQNSSKKAGYKMVMDVDGNDSFDYDTEEPTNTDQLFDTDTEGVTVGVPLEKNFGVGGSDGRVKVLKGQAKLTDISQATVKGNYKDTLTYSFNENSNIKK